MESFVTLYTTVSQIAERLEDPDGDRRMFAAAVFVLFEEDRLTRTSPDPGVRAAVTVVLRDAEKTGRLAWVSAEQHRDYMRIATDLLQGLGHPIEIDEWVGVIGHRAYLRAELERRLTATTGTGRTYGNYVDVVA